MFIIWLQGIWLPLHGYAYEQAAAPVVDAVPFGGPGSQPQRGREHGRSAPVQ